MTARAWMAAAALLATARPNEGSLGLDGWDGFTGLRTNYTSYPTYRTKPRTSQKAQARIAKKRRAVKRARRLGHA